MTKVCILDYGSGNVKSVFNLFSLIAEKTFVSNLPQAIEDASHVVLPGVGAFGAAMRKIRQNLPLETIERSVRDQGKPFLGICVGMQILANKGSEFGEHDGLGWIPGKVDKLDPGDLPLPHIGWNSISATREDPLLAGLDACPDFYFVHSFTFRTERKSSVLATTQFGEKFCSILNEGNVYGVQFHPEKSQKAGMRLAQNFLALA